MSLEEEDEHRRYHRGKRSHQRPGLDIVAPTKRHRGRACCDDGADDQQQDACARIQYGVTYQQPHQRGPADQRPRLDSATPQPVKRVESGIIPDFPSGPELSSEIQPGACLLQ